MKIKINERYPIIIMLLYSLLGIQNRFFDDMFSLGGMDAISLLLSILLILYFCISILQKKIKLNYFMLLFILIFVYRLSIAIILNYSLKSIMLDIRIFISFVFSYFIFKSIKISEKKLDNILILGGFLNSAIFLYFMIGLFKEKGINVRDVSINLYISLLSLGLLIYEENNKNKFKILIIILNAVSVIISQQRTQIIPLCILLIVFLTKNIKFNYKKIIKISLGIVIGAILINTLNKLGFLDIVLDRFSQKRFSGEESTLIVRINAMKKAFQNSSIIIMIFGSGFGYSYSKLEMIVPNYILKYGILNTVIIFGVLLKSVINKYPRYSDNQKRILFVYCIVLVGGFISGFAENTGQMFNGVVLGILTNSNYLCIDNNNIKNI